MALRAYHHREFPPARIAAGRTSTVSICLPARNEARTIGPILEQLMPLRAQGVVDQIVVVDDSDDETGEIARRAGAEVHDQHQLAPGLGPVLGKGDAMWRSLAVLRGDVICFLDADSEEFGAHFACGLIGPLVCSGDSDTAFVKGFYRRPFRVGDTTLPDGGGRVTELMARPLLKAFYPELTAVRQPLAGEIAARRDLIEQLPFVTGYGVDIGLLLDSYELVGLAGLAQVDLEVRQNAHKSLHDLGPMADEVLQAVSARLERAGRLAPLVSQPVERPPLADLRAAA
jgi:glucosyl-3-phosphoglycerate synthase